MADNTKQTKSLKNAIIKNFYMLKLAYQVYPQQVIGSFIEPLLYNIRWLYLSIVMMEFLFGFIENKADFRIVATFVICSVIGLFCVNLFYVIFYTVIEPVGNQKLYEKLHVMMFKKATDVELECYENYDFYDKYTKAASQIKGRAVSVLNNLPPLIISLFSIIYLLIKTISIDKYAVLFAILPVISTYLIGNKLNMVRYELYQENIPHDRQKEYVKRTLYMQNFSKEIRLSNVFNVLTLNFNAAISEILNNIQKYGMRLGLLSCSQESINRLFVLTGSIAYATIRIVYFKDLKISEFIVLVNAISNISDMLISNARRINKIQDNSLYIDNLKDFLEYEPKISQSQDGLMPKREGTHIKLKNLYYTYLGQTEPVLKNINIEIKPKQKIALVGHNGAGKTTLVKIIMRLYDATQGEILLDGINIKEYNVKAYRDLYATVFQDYKVISMSVAENVLMGDVTEEDRKKVETALKESGAYDKVMTLKNGMNTTLTREFDSEGAVLSGGECQKIAIARVFAKECEIAILDEPSSALDPIAEYKMYESMMKACEEKAVIFISHRLSSAVLADKIYMMENGKIMEEGSHSELMACNGKYAAMFQMQAKSYK